MIKKIESYLNANPKTKYILSTGEGAAFGVVFSYIVGVLNGSGTITVTGLKRTAAMALVNGLTAAYNLWKTPPTPVP